jgi:hypothetical protein
VSVIAVKVREGGYDIASDSIQVRYSTQSKGDRTSMAKLMEINGMVIGAVGASEEASLLFLFAETRKPERPTQMGILNFLNDFNEWKHKKIGKYFGGNEYFICFEGSVFHINGWQIDFVRSYEAIGAGMDYALAALYFGHSAEESVECAIHLSCYCEGPVISISKGE